MDFDEISWRGRAWRPGTNKLNFGDDPDHRPDPGVQSPKSGFTGLSKKYLVDSDQSCIANLHCKKSFSNSIMLAFGGGLCSLSTSSCIMKRVVNFTTVG